MSGESEGTGSGYRRGEARSEYSGIIFSVKESVKFFDGMVPIMAKHFKVLNVGVSMLHSHTGGRRDDFPVPFFLAAFAVVDVFAPSGCGKYAAWVVLLLLK